MHINDELGRVFASFSSLFHFQAIKYSSAGTERSQSQPDYPECLWVYDPDEMLSIGIEEVSDSPKVLNHPAPSPTSTFSVLETDIYLERFHCHLHARSRLESQD